MYAYREQGADVGEHLGAPGAFEQGSEMTSLMFAKDDSGWLGGEELARGRLE